MNYALSKISKNQLLKVARMDELIKEALEIYRESLCKITGVQGIGKGKTKETRELCVLVFVDENYVGGITETLKVNDKLIQTRVHALRESVKVY